MTAREADNRITVASVKQTLVVAVTVTCQDTAVLSLKA